MKTVNAIALALLLGFFFGTAYVYVTDPGDASLIRRGDFAGFYSVAEILRLHGAKAMYDFSLQSEIQNRIWPSFQGAFYMLVYPPQFCASLLSLAWMSPVEAKAAAVVVMACCILLGGYLWCCSFPGLREARFLIPVLLLWTLPNMLSVWSGQNTGLSLLFYGTGSFFVLRNSHRSRYLGGLVFSLLLYKPQLGIPAACLLLCLRDKNITAGVLSGALAQYVFAACLTGSFWLEPWLKALCSFQSVNIRLNGVQMISLSGLVTQISGMLSQYFSDPVAALNTGRAASAVSLGLLLYYFWRKSADGQQVRRLLCILGPAVLFCGEQVLFYDFGFALLPLFTLVPGQGWKRAAGCAALCGILWPLHWHHSDYGINLLALVVTSGLAVLLAASRTPWAISRSG